MAGPNTAGGGGRRGGEEREEAEDWAWWGELVLAGLVVAVAEVEVIELAVGAGGGCGRLMEETDDMIRGLAFLLDLLGRNDLRIK